ncbi:MAG: tetratricopeptide repeat protein [Saprospiraceae bacterium]|nr:tetratricopeptide repeat protein [Saprospiraceae bacterium]
MIRKIQITLTAFILLMGMQLHAQKILKKADLQFETGAFSQAIESYSNYLADTPNDWKAIGRIADSYAYLGNEVEAIRWYDKLTNLKDVDPTLFLRFGHSLKKTGQLDNARSMYEKYSVYQPEVGNHFALSCDFALHSLQMPATHETMVLPLNSTASDFGLTFYNSYPVFSSFRKDIMMTELEKELNLTENAHKSYIYNDKKKRLGFIKGITGNFNHIGPVSFAKNSKICTIIESKINEENSFITPGKNSTLYIAVVNAQGEIIESKPFAYNEMGSSINSASMAFDGSAIYFSSDRKGGFGGFDLYVSYLNNGIWSAPKNLGSAVNSSGNEITPFFDENILYFASDYHMGIGGFDVFRSKVVNGDWQEPVNLGNGVNSLGDDYFPCVHNNELYFTSNRLGGKGSNDIYKAIALVSEMIVSAPVNEPQPKAVSLEGLSEANHIQSKESEVVHSVSLESTEVIKSESESNEASKVAFVLPEFNVHKVGSNANTEVSVLGARRVALEEFLPNVEVFFIQLASMSAVQPNFTPFKGLVKYGNIYKVNNNRSIKVRLGYYNDRSEAEEVLKVVRTKGFKDAFITFELLNTAQMELVLTSMDGDSYSDQGNFKTKNPEVKNYTATGQYKVRLASYEDPIWFDVNKVKDIGRVEQWTKGSWTIFILAGYESLEEAKQAQIKAINRGFNTAEIVIDNGGILEKLKQN